MKRLILVSLVLALFISSAAMAKEEAIDLVATASSFHGSNEERCGPRKSIDGNYSTFWLGQRHESPWWIMFDAGEPKDISDINMIWYAPSYVPQSYDIQISDNATTWENVYTDIPGAYEIKGELKEINRQARYIRLYINTAGHYPVLREFSAFVELDVPRTIRFQAALGDPEKTPLSGTYNFTFRLYDEETGGISLWEESQTGIYIENGLLDIELGSVMPIDLTFDRQYWLGVKVDPDNEITPRFKLTTVPYEFVSER